MFFSYRFLQIFGLFLFATGVYIALETVSIPDSSTLVQTRGEVLHAWRGKGRRGSVGRIYFQINTVSRTLAYPAYFSNEKGVWDLFQPGATVEIRHPSGRPNEIVTMVVGGRLLGTAEDLREFNRSRRLHGPIIGAFAIGAISFIEWLVWKEPSNRRK